MECNHEQLVTALEPQPTGHNRVFSVLRRSCKTVIAASLVDNLEGILRGIEKQCEYLMREFVRIANAIEKSSSKL